MTVEPPPGWTICCQWCGQPAGWSMASGPVRMVVCDDHYDDGLAAVQNACPAGVEPRVVDLWPDVHDTLF